MQLKNLLAAACTFGLLAAFPLTADDSVFGQFSSSSTQLPQDVSFVRLENKNGARKVQLSDNNQKIVIQKAGLYSINVSVQVGDQTFTREGDVTLWLNRNNNVLPHTGVSKAINRWRTRDNLETHVVMELNAKDTISIGFSSTIDGLGLIATQADEGEAGIPSAIVTIFKINN